MKEIILPSGAKLEIDEQTPMKVSKSLLTACTEEMKSLRIDAQAEVDVNFFKDLFCAGLSSRKIEQALDECMKRCLYNGLRINEDTWEPLKAREDYLIVCWEVAQSNIRPFTKSLFAEYKAKLQELISSLELKSKTMTS